MCAAGRTYKLNALAMNVQVDLARAAEPSSTRLASRFAPILVDDCHTASYNYIHAID